MAPASTAAPMRIVSNKPSSLKSGETVWDHANKIVWLGDGDASSLWTSNVIPIGGIGAYLALTGSQTIAGDKFFTGKVDMSSAHPTVPLAALNDPSNAAASTEFVYSLLATLPAEGAIEVTVVSCLADLRALLVRPALVYVLGTVAAGDGGESPFRWVADDISVADGVLAVRCTSGPAGLYMRIVQPSRVNLGWFTEKSNPLQSALDALGVVGGRIDVPNLEFNVSGRVESVTNLRNFHLEGQGPKSALVYSDGTGGILLHMNTPSGVEEQQDQVIIKGIAFLTTYYGANSGRAIDARWAVAVGDKSQGVTIRDCQFLPKNHNAVNGQYAWWEAGIYLWNARENTIDNCIFGGGSLQVEGWAIELDGGTVQTQIDNISATDLDTGVYAHGVVEGIFIHNSAFVDCVNAVWVDGDELGDARTTSSTSQTIGTGSKTFTVAHSGLAWDVVGLGLFVRDSAAPSTNWMWGQITAYSGTSVTFNITATGGSGTHASWDVSPEHRISGINIHDIHTSASHCALFARHTAFGFWHDIQSQKREGTGANYVDLIFADFNTTWFVHDLHFIARGTGGFEGGIDIYDQWNGAVAQNYNFSIHHLEVANRDYAVWIGAGASNIDIDVIRSVGDVTEMIINDALANHGVTVHRVFNDNVTTLAGVSFAANDTTPRVSSEGFEDFYTANTAPTSVTYFDGANVGQIWRVLINDAQTSLVHSASLILKGGVNYSPVNGVTMCFQQWNSTTVRELWRSA